MIYIFYQTRLFINKNLISYKVKSLIVAVIIDISRTPKFLKSIIYKEIARFHVTDMNDSYLKMDQECNRKHVKSFLEESFVLMAWVITSLLKILATIMNWLYWRRGISNRLDCSSVCTAAWYLAVRKNVQNIYVPTILCSNFIYP